MVSGSVLRQLRWWLVSAWRALTSVPGWIARVLGLETGVDPHTRVTFRAVVDAVVPETPALADELGEEHVPGGLAVDLDEFAIEYVNRGFQLGVQGAGPQGTLPLADPVAHVLDTAALALLSRGDNADEPRTERALALLDADDPDPETVEAAVGPFARLSRQDRLRAVAILDGIDVAVTPTEDDLFEVDGGLVGQLVVGFVEFIYYSEWQGYEDYWRPPDERSHPDDPAAVQSWRQTGFPGFADGYAALRGYVGLDGSDLGAGEPWATVDEDAGVHVVRESGAFRENDYDTSDYTEPFPVAGE